MSYGVISGLVLKENDQYDFDGTSKVEVAGHPISDQNFQIGCWIKPDAYLADNAIFKVGIALTIEFVGGLNSIRATWTAETTNAVTTTSVGFSAGEGGWLTVAWDSPARTFTIYKNEVELSSTKQAGMGAMGAITNKLVIGDKYDGKMAAVWYKALSLNLSTLVSKDR